MTLVYFFGFLASILLLSAFNAPMPFTLLWAVVGGAALAQHRRNEARRRRAEDEEGDDEDEERL